MATTTAHGLYRYDTMVNGKTLLEHAQLLNEYLMRKNGWSSNAILTPGQWGTDVNVSRIASALINIDEDIDVIAQRIHVGWAKCFKFWVDHRPWMWEAGYRLPGKSLFANQKMDRSNKPFEELDDRHKSMYRQMAEYVLKYC